MLSFIAASQLVVVADRPRAAARLERGHFEPNATAMQERHPRGASATRGDALGACEVTPWGPGPVIAGHVTVYHVITHGDEICAEMLVSGWMKAFMAPVVARPRAAAAARASRFTVCAAGWPMLAGKIDHLTFETR
ncbi:MAG: hypothetical protein ACRDZV_15065, partial [Acidimicrobiia bacterium]